MKKNSTKIKRMDKFDRPMRKREFGHRFTRKRQEICREFRLLSEGRSSEVGEIGSQMWLQKLLALLTVRGHAVTEDSIRIWMDRFPGQFTGDEYEELDTDSESMSGHHPNSSLSNANRSPVNLKVARPSLRPCPTLSLPLHLRSPLLLPSSSSSSRSLEKAHPTSILRSTGNTTMSSGSAASGSGSISGPACISSPITSQNISKVSDLDKPDTEYQKKKEIFTRAFDNISQLHEICIQCPEVAVCLEPLEKISNIFIRHHKNLMFPTSYRKNMQERLGKLMKIEAITKDSSFSSSSSSSSGPLHENYEHEMYDSNHITGHINMNMNINMNVNEQEDEHDEPPEMVILA